MGKLVDLLDDLTNGTGRYKKSLDQLAASASVAEGRFDVIRKLLQPNRSLDPDEEGGSSKVDTSDLDATIARFKKLQEQYKQIANSTEESYQVRLDAQEQFVIFSNGINNAQFEKDIRLAKDNENKKQQAIAKLNLADLKLKKKAKEQEAKLIESFINDELKEIEAAAKAKIDAEVAIIKTKYKLLGALTIEQEKEMQRQITAFTNKVNDKKLEDQSAAINDFLNLMGIEGELKIELTRKIQEILSKISEAGRRNDIEAFKFHLEDLRELVLNIADIGDALFERKIENIDAEIKAEEDKYDKLINLAKDDVAQREALEEEKQLTIEKLEKKRLKVEQNQARVRKAAAIAEIAINVAIGVSKAWTKGAFLGGLESALIIANGVLQTAAVLATPIPQYKEGLERADKDHIAMINDGGRQEYIKRNGKILTTTKKDAIVGIQKGDTVYKSYEDMKNKILLTSALSNGQALNEGQFNNLLTGISGAIKEGWKEAKITNRLRLNNSGSNNDAYKQAQSRWN
jgi:hypothetical protein